MSDYVVCPATVTSPAADPGEPPYLPPDLPCGEHVAVVMRAAVMEMRCPRGHVFFARLEDIPSDDHHQGLVDPRSPQESS